MSRIGKKPVPVVSGVKVAVNDHLVKVEGPKGKLELNVHPAINVKYDDVGLEFGNLFECYRTVGSSADNLQFGIL